MAAKQRVQQEAQRGEALVEALRENPYVQRLLADDELRSHLQEAVESGKSAYERANKKGRRGGAKKLITDEKLHDELRSAFEAAKSAQAALQDAPKHPTKNPKKRKGRGRLLGLALLGGAVALVVSGGLRDKLLDVLFGPEETFDYVPQANGNGSTPAATPDAAAKH
ncbi:MAG: hypothetical protein PGN13_04155 [Patulibacter minatonensis]